MLVLAPVPVLLPIPVPAQTLALAITSTSAKKIASAGTSTDATTSTSVAPTNRGAIAGCTQCMHRQIGGHRYPGSDALGSYCFNDHLVSSASALTISVVSSPAARA